MRNVLASPEQLPPNLQELMLRHHGRDCSNGSSYSLRPLLALSRLQKLQLGMRDAAPAAEDLAALSSISSLTELGLSYTKAELLHEEQTNTEQAAAAEATAEAAAEAAAAAWHLLPLKALSWNSSYIPATIIEQASALQGLTRLELHTWSAHLGDQLAPVQLAAMLRALTGLQRLQLTRRSVGFPGKSDNAAHRDNIYRFEPDAVASLLQAIGGLRELGGARVELQMHLTKSAADELDGRLQELLPSWMLGRHCRVTVDLLKFDTGGFGLMS
jgi:hypothetical protein